jgi:hypothetical protein
MTGSVCGGVGIEEKYEQNNISFTILADGLGRH